MSEKVWKRGRVWTQKHLEADVRLVEVRNFAKRKMAGLKDDVHDADWGPNSDGSLKDYLTGYNGALEDLERWVMELVDDE
tara:strand:+ start:50 stop:289 length:240 start_codon:yes stop_codon:yes gene_type:complete